MHPTTRRPKEHLPCGLGLFWLFCSCGVLGIPPPPVHPLPVKFNSLSLQRPALAWTLVHTHAQDEPTGYLLVRGKNRGGLSHPFFPSIKCRGHYVVATLTPLFICETKPPTRCVRCINSGENLSLPDLGVRTAPGFALLWLDSKRGLSSTSNARSLSAKRRIHW